MTHSTTRSITRSRVRVSKGLGLLALRLTFGGLMMAHGAQKLFGWWEGPGIQGTSGWLESLKMRPGRFWAWLAALSEFGGGLLTALGFLNPIGPLAAFGAMAMAAVKAHLGKPIWASKGGAELPLTNMAIATALMSRGPGVFSLDRLFGIRLPRWLLIPGLIGVIATVAYGHYGHRLPELQAKVNQMLQGATQSAQLARNQLTQQTRQSMRTETPSANGATSGQAGTAGQTSYTARP